MPEFIKPQLATQKTKAPSGAQWLHEIKYDGYRVQVHLNGGRKRVFTRNGLDWTKRFTASMSTNPNGRAAEPPGGRNFSYTFGDMGDVARFDSEAAIVVLAHWASDVVAGFALGALTERLLRFWTGYPLRASKEDEHANP